MTLLGLLFTTLFTFTLADAADTIVTATCTFGTENFLNFDGEVQISIDVTTPAITITGTVNNNAMSRWSAIQAHDVQIRSISDLTNFCLNTGDVFWDIGDQTTDANANLVFNVNALAPPAGVDVTKIVGRPLVIQKDNQAAAANAIVACCIITAVGSPTPPWTTTPPPLTATTTVPVVAWPYSWPPDWVPPPGCTYIPQSYYQYQASTTTTAITTTYNPIYYTGAPTPPPTTVYWDPYSGQPPPPPPPPPPTVYYYNYAPPATTKATTTTSYNYCWTCPQPYYGQEPPASAYYQTTCPPTCYYPHCPASHAVLGALAALVAALALFF